MSHKTARTHSHVSNRAKPGKTEDRKVVFKSVLDSPFRIQWPSVPVNVQNSILALTVGMLDGVADYHSSRGKGSRKRKHEQRIESKRNKRRKIEGVVTMETQPPTMDELASNDPPENSPATASKDLPSGVERPAILEHIVVGINEVTRRLEAQIRDQRLSINISTTEKPKSTLPSTLRTILVCRGDVDPPLLIDHLPHLVAAYNSSQPANVVKIIPLPKGAEAALAQATGLRRAAVFAVDMNFDGLSNFTTLLDTVPTLAAPWLSNAAHHQQLIPTHIKQVRTSAPKDMKAAKQRRVEGKASAKQRRQPIPIPQ